MVESPFPDSLKNSKLYKAIPKAIPTCCVFRFVDSFKQSVLREDEHEKTPTQRHVATRNGFDTTAGMQEVEQRRSRCRGIGGSENGPGRKTGKERGSSGQWPSFEEDSRVLGVKNELNCVPMLPDLMHKDVYLSYTRNP